MSTPVTQEHPATVAATPAVVEVESRADRIEAVTKTVTERAYDLFHGRNGADGGALGDWLKAEEELLGPMAVEVRQTDAEVVANVHVPGFKAEDITVSVEPRRLTITGKREESSERREGESVCSERSSGAVYRSLTLPANVEPSTASTELADGMLTITMTKAPKPEPQSVEVKAG